MGAKGGSGKSTVALHLAGALSQNARTVLLDLDDTNRTAAEYAAAGRLPYPVATPDTWGEVAREAWAHVVIDTPARPTPEQARWLGERADLAIIPTPPDAVSLRVLARTLPTIASAGTPFRVLLVRTPPPPSRDAQRALASLRAGSVPTFSASVPETAAVRHAARMQRLAWEVPRVKTWHVRDAFEALAKEVTEYAEAR